MDKTLLYISKKVLISIAIILVVVTLLLFFLQSLRFLDLIINRGFSIFILIYVSYLTLTSIWVEILPFSLIIGIVFTWNNMLSNQELIIIQATGVSPLKTSLSLIYIGIVFSIISFFFTFHIVPNSYIKYQELRSKISNNYNLKLIEAGKFVNLNDDTTFFIDKIQGNKFISIFIYSNNRTEKKENYIYAETGYIDFSKNNVIFLLEKTNIQEIENNNSIKYIQLDKYIFNTNPNKKTQTTIKSNPKELNVFDLLTYNNLEYIRWYKNNNIEKYNQELRKIKIEILKRVYNTLLPLFLTIVAAYFFSIRQFKRLGNIKPILQTSTLGVLTKIAIILSVASNSIKISTLPIIAMVILIVYMLYKIILPPTLKTIAKYKFFA